MPFISTRWIAAASLRSIHPERSSTPRSGPLRCLAALLVLALTWLPCVPALAQEAAGGAIRGTVLDREVEAPLAGVRVVILGSVLETRTGEDGTFLFSRLPAGSYSLAFTKEGYERQVLSGIVVVAGKMADVRASLGIEVVEMEELVVTGGDLALGEEGGLLDIRAEAVAFQDAISADLISKAGASDVAGALKLVVGASITEGKYATVRGLSDRYTGTTLNGVRVPSADPRRRAVQVDLFPTGTLENLSVTKTFTPDLQGEFTGGGVDIQTRSIPEKLTYAVSLGAENNSLATGNDAFLTYEGGGTPLLGGGADDRALPEAAKEAYKSIPPIPNNLFRAPYTAEKIAISDAYDRLVRSFDPAMGVTTDTPGLNGSFSFVGGNRWERGNDRVLGILGALTFQHKYDLMEDAQNNNGTVSLPDQPMQLVSRSETRGTEETLTGLLINFEFVAGQNQRYALNLIGNRSAEDEARFQVQTLGGGVERQNQALHYTERFVGSAQIHGEHHSGEKQGQGLDWFVAYNDTSQEEPDVRFFRNDFNNETLVGLKPRDSTDPSNTRRIWRDVGESNWQSAVNYSLPFSTWGDLSATLRGGVRLDRTDRDYEQRSFTYNFPTQAPGNDAARENLQLASFHATDADQLWTDVFTDSNRIGLATNHPPAPNQLLWIITPLTSSDVDYTGSQDIDAAFAMAEFPFRSNFKAIAGVRLESTDLSVIPTNERLGKVDVIVVNPDSGDRGIQRVDQELAVADIKDKALLPSAGLVWSIRQGMSLRGTVSATIARPNFRELAPVATEEFIFGDEYVGNPDLTLSRINNYDLRWEWFPRPGAVLAGSAFYKQIRNPIELISFAAGGRSFIQPVNYERGKLSGVELEARSSMEWAADWLKDLSVGVNLTLINSEVEVPASEQESLASFELDEPTRRLQGQPDKIWNANLTYDSERFGTSVGIFYNVTGEMLLTGAARGAEDAVPNVFQEEFKSLDVTLAQRIGKGFSVAVKGKNLLAPEARTVYRTPSGEETVKTERETARLLGISFTWKW